MYRDVLEGQMKLLPAVWFGPRNNQISFGDDTDYDPDHTGCETQITLINLGERDVCSLWQTDCLGLYNLTKHQTPWTPIKTNKSG